MDYQDKNAETIDRWIDEGWEWGIPISHEEYVKAQQGDWGVLLTPTKPVPKEWFGDLKGKRVLGLASGGGQQMPIFAALGAVCTVFDYSPRQLESERLVAEREGYPIEIIRGDMTKPLPFEDGSFDLIFHPVSNCYVREVKPVFKECFRILAPGGALLSGLDNGINFLFLEEDKRDELSYFPFDPVANPRQREQLEEADDGFQFSHTMEEQIGGQLEAGFRLTHLYEDTNGAGTFHEHNIPCFLATRAVKENSGMEPDIQRVDCYNDPRFSRKVLCQHGAFLVDGEPYEVEILDRDSAVIRGARPELYSGVIEDFRFFAGHISRFYNSTGELIQEFEPVELFSVKLDAVQPSQFYVDEEKLAAAVELGIDKALAFTTSADDVLHSFAEEARNRGVFSPYDLPVIPHGEYEVKWNQFCDEFFAKRGE